MEILVIDRESLTNQLISSRLGAKGHHVVAEPNKNLAFDMIKGGKFDCIMVDPAPLSEARPVVIGIWKNIRAVVKPYLLLLSKTGTTEEAILAGCNDVLNKPLSNQDLETKISNAERIMEICRMLATEDNVHSSGGMIGKAAFNQLFLSAIDRAFRYGERSLIVFIEVTNHDEVVKAVGAPAFEETIKKLTEKMTFMRRQSDVIGRLGAEVFAILLQRPQYETEPIDAINRFSEVLDKFYQAFEDKRGAPKLHLRLIELPQGSQRTDRRVPLADALAAAGDEA
ncbi:MAG: diguanylate cyclase [Alphaproteobacteria bacterium]|nr:MAG: diguanylate cyclase [Alphaproteobacteria bacterium]